MTGAQTVDFPLGVLDVMQTNLTMLMAAQSPEHVSDGELTLRQLPMIMRKAARQYFRIDMRLK
jgi:hypothetical protein